MARRCAALLPATPLPLDAAPVKFASWMGGDRDGNPFVKPATTAFALRLQMREVLICYLHRVEALARRLTHSLRLCAFSRELLDSIASDEKRFSEACAKYPRRYAHEPYRRKLCIMRHRLKLNLTAVSERLENPDINPATQQIGYTSEPQGFVLKVDRPFLFWLYDRATGTVLFLGRVLDPSA